MKLIHSSGLKGLFRLIGVGNLTLGRPQNPRAKFLYRPGYMGREGLRYGSGSVSVDAPFGELLNLPVGTLLMNDLPIWRADVSTSFVRVAFHGEGAYSATRQELEDKGLLPRMDRLGPAAAESGVASSRWYVCPAPDSHFSCVIFPATALFTTYFATTSRLADRIFAGDIADIDGKLINRHKTSPVDKNGHAKITFRRGVLAAEALPLARAWYDETGFYLEAFKNIHRYISAQVSKGEPISLRCEPPIRGEVTLNIEGMVSQSAGSIHLIALRILNSDEPLPFTSLDAHVDQSNHKRCGQGVDSPEERPGPPFPPESPREFFGEFLKLVDENDQPCSDQPLVVPLQLSSTRFDSLRPGSLRIVRRDAGPRAGKRAPVKPEAEKHSAAKGSANGDPAMREAQLSQRGPAVEESGDSGSESVHHSPEAALDALLEAAAAMVRDLRIEVSARQVSKRGTKFRSLVFNEVDTDIPGRSGSWAYVSSDPKLARPVLIMELARNGRYAYLLEIIRRPSEEFSTLSFCAGTRARLSDAELRCVLTLVDDLQGLPTPAQVRIALGFDRDSPPGGNATAPEAVRVKHDYFQSPSYAERLSALLAPLRT